MRESRLSRAGVEACWNARASRRRRTTNVSVQLVVLILLYQSHLTSLILPSMILEIKNAVTIPVMAKARIGHFVESQIIELEQNYNQNIDYR